MPHPTFINAPSLGRVFRADSLVAITEVSGTSRAFFSDGGEQSIWQQSHIAFAEQVNRALPDPLLRISTGGAVRRIAFVNLLAVTGWTGTATALHLRTHNATIVLPGFDIGHMNDALAAAGIKLGAVQPKMVAA